MYKLNNKGFLLAELLIVVTIITTTLTILFLQISSLFINYTNKIYNYDTANSLYAGYTLKKAFQSEDLTNIVTDAGFVKNDYLKIDLNMLSIDTFLTTPVNTSGSDFYETLVNSLNIKEMYFTTYDPTKLASSSDISFGLKKYLNSIKLDEELDDNVYRIVLVLEDDSYSSLVISFSSKS